MLLTETSIVKWRGNTRKHYEEKGYIFTKTSEEFEVKTEDLTNGANNLIESFCDYCGKECKPKLYNMYVRLRRIVAKDCCEKCAPLKQKDIYLFKYGVEHYNQLPEERIKMGNRKRLHNIEEVRELFKEAGYELLSNEYINNETHLEYICPKHGLKEIALGHFLMGKRCCECKHEEYSGENNNMWQGGIDETNHHLRSMLYYWKQESLEKFDYKCCISGINSNLQIHHAYPFRNIVQDVFNELNIEIQPRVCDYIKEDLIKIEELFLQKHKGKIGYPLTKELHNEFHMLYGTRNNTESDFYEFINDKTTKII